jgi:hypothetical protein
LDGACEGKRHMRQYPERVSYRELLDYIDPFDDGGQF